MPSQPSPSERISTLDAFSRQRPCALLNLAAALEDPCITVRTEAARLLGLSGGAEETAKLREALSRAIGRRSPLWYRVLGWLTVAGLGLLVAVMIVLIGVLSFGQAFKLKDIKPSDIWRNIVEAQRGEEPFIAACVEALAAISERAPTPESRQLVGELRRLASDETHLTRNTRAAMATAADRLEAATRELAELPTPAAAPQPSTESLPVAAEEPVQTVALGR